MRPLTMPRAFRTGAMLALSAVISGCSADSDRLKQQLREMETELTAVRADQDRFEERLEAVELSAAVVAREQDAPVQVESRPRLKVIRLAPDQPAQPPSQAPPTPPGAPESSDEPRPVIRGTGNNVTQSGGSAQRADDSSDRPVIALSGDEPVRSEQRGD